MGRTPIVLEHAYKHGLSKRDILHAWRNAYVERVREGKYPTEHVSIGPDRSGRDIQLVSVWSEELGRPVIFHAMKATRNVKQEIGVL